MSERKRNTITEKTASRNTNVVVISGGYAGVMAANRPHEAAGVTLVNPRAKLVERIRLHQQVADTTANSSAAVADFAASLNPGVQLVIGRSTQLIRSRRVHRPVAAHEPLLTEQDASADELLAESVSMAMLVVLETLSPYRTRRVRTSGSVRVLLRRDRLDDRQIDGCDHHALVGESSNRGQNGLVEHLPEDGAIHCLRRFRRHRVDLAAGDGSMCSP